MTCSDASSVVVNLDNLVILSTSSTTGLSVGMKIISTKKQVNESKVVHNQLLQYRDHLVHKFGSLGCIFALKKGIKYESNIFFFRLLPYLTCGNLQVIKANKCS